MTGNRDRFGELIEEDDLTTSSFCQDELVVPTRRPATRDEIHHDRCAQLRVIIRAAKARREAQE